MAAMCYCSLFKNPDLILYSVPKVGQSGKKPVNGFALLNMEQTVMKNGGLMPYQATVHPREEKPEMCDFYDCTVSLASVKKPNMATIGRTWDDGSRSWFCSFDHYFQGAYGD